MSLKDFLNAILIFVNSIYDDRYLTGFVSCVQYSVIAVTEEKITMPLHSINLIL